jgi:hypothetical protein
VLRKAAGLNAADDPVFNKDIRLGRRGGFSGNKDSAEEKSGHGRRNGGEYTAGKDQHPAASKRKGQTSRAGAVR